MVFTNFHKKWARYQGGSSVIDGFFSTGSNIGTVGRTMTSTNGTATTFACAATTGTPAGMLNTSTTLLCRALYPSIEVKFAISLLTNTRVFIGFHNSGSSPTGEDWLNGTGKSGVLFGKRAADTNWFIMTNNLTVGATIFTDTGVAIGADAAVHTVKIVADDSGARFGYIIDGSAIAYVSTQVPATSTALGPVVHLETAENVAKTLSMYDMICMVDK